MQGIVERVRRRQKLSWGLCTPINAQLNNLPFRFAAGIRRGLLSLNTADFGHKGSTIRRIVTVFRRADDEPSDYHTPEDFQIGNTGEHTRRGETAEVARPGSIR